MAEPIGEAFVEIGARNEALKAGLRESEQVTRASMGQVTETTKSKLFQSEEITRGSTRRMAMAFSGMAAQAGGSLGTLGTGIRLVSTALFSWPVAALAAGGVLTGVLIGVYTEAKKLRKETEYLAARYDLSAAAARELAKVSKEEREAFTETYKITGQIKEAEEAANMIRMLTVKGKYTLKEATEAVIAAKKGDLSVTLELLDAEKRYTEDLLSFMDKREQKELAEIIQREMAAEEAKKVVTELESKARRFATPISIGKHPGWELAPLGEEDYKKLTKARIDAQVSITDSERKATLEQEMTIRRNAKLLENYNKERAEYSEEYMKKQEEEKDKIFVNRQIIRQNEIDALKEEFMEKQKAAKEEEALAAELERLHEMGRENEKERAADIARIDKESQMGVRERQLDEYRGEIETLEKEKRAHKDAFDEMLDARRESLEQMRAEMGAFMAPGQIWRQMMTGEFQVKIAEREYQREERSLRKENNRILKDLDATIEGLRNEIAQLKSGD